MRVFLSYSSDRRPLAETINHLLLSEGHDVFFDRDDLQPGETYGERIRRAIARCHVFVFLISPGSVEEGSYAVSELAMLHQLPPRRRPVVLPVLTTSGLAERLPALLRPLTLFEPHGDPAAEVAAKIDLHRRRRTRPRRAIALLSLVVLAILIAGLGSDAGRARARLLLASLARGSDAAATAPERPVRVRAIPGNEEWSLTLEAPALHVRELRYRFESDDSSRSTGFEPTHDPVTGRPLARTWIPSPDLPMKSVLFVEYVDSAGRGHGPFRVEIDLADELVAFTKHVLDVTSWVEFGRHSDGAIVYFSHVLSYKNALRAIRYSFDDETLTRSVRFTPDSIRAGIGRIRDEDELYTAVPAGAAWLALQLDFIDGTTSPVRRFPVAGNAPR